MKRIVVDFEHGLVEAHGEDGVREFGLGSAEGFEAVSKAWLRAGWDAKYVYGFSWLGRPIIQLPDDMVRLQEVIYDCKPDVIVETGIAHGGSLVFSAGLCKLMGKGRVIGVDIEIRPHNRQAIEDHELAGLITLIEGNSVGSDVLEEVADSIRPADRVLVFLDSNHSYQHVFAELEAYAPLVSPGSYIVAMDGIMGELSGAPRTDPDWDWNNPRRAVHDFVAAHEGTFVVEEPTRPFDEGTSGARVTYWPDAFVRRIP